MHARKKMKIIPNSQNDKETSLTPHQTVNPRALGVKIFCFKFLWCFL
jgi:hypothetical protein